MRRLSWLILFNCIVISGFSQNPHGENLIIDCASCHSASGWAVSMDTFSFNHDTLAFALTGLHRSVDCKSCHTSLIFEDTPSDCISCHADIHSMSVGNDCMRCHTTENWLVDDIPELHEANGFPLLGGHGNLSCVDCHFSETHLRFDRIGNDCISCHRTDYENTTDPDHIAGGYSENCMDCHDPMSHNWDSEGILHDFFPLTLGHDISDCNQCHLTDNFSDASPECISCHEVDFNNTTNPNHMASNISTDCVSCHTTNPGWKPAEFLEHDGLHFPIYSGAHQGEWDACTDCHIQADDYSIFSCIVCHDKPDTDDEHDDVPGYVYADLACLACHPNGEEESSFNHNQTNFPLTGAHIGLECLDCHSEGFSNTPTDCFFCHSEDFNATINPNHNELGISTDCASCHTTEPDWRPAGFDIHDDYYELNGAHAIIAADCVSCHNGDYNITPNTCVGCHLDDYNETIDPNHSEAQFSTDCASCHTESEWIPSTFDHDAENFPIYSGSHEGEWLECLDCHTDPNNFMLFQCINCHTNPDTDEKHILVGGYVYEDNACFACHPTGDADMAFDHDDTDFPLTGAHIFTACIDCHENGYEGTPTDCNFCHSDDYNQSTNPPHNSLEISTDCIACHTTEPGWAPASFDIHDDYYMLTGAHVPIAQDCASCHNGDYVNTPNDCVGCHQIDFDQSLNPNHTGIGISTDCASCHSTEAGWMPASFDIHDDYYALTGVHATIAQDCAACHNGDYLNTPNDCVGCHQIDYDQTVNPDHQNLSISNDCVSCHSTDPEWMPASFDVHDDYYALNGAHAIIANDCVSCHNGDYNNTPNTCIACHQSDYDDATNPDHLELMFSTDCLECHTEDAWSPTNFNHDDIFQLNGAHALISNDCLACHSDGYDNTPNTCVGCHQSDYDDATNPDHNEAMFSTDCLECHTEDSWSPTSFDHDEIFQLNGAHALISNDCLTCHSGGYDNTPNTCIACHQSDYDDATNPDHLELMFSTDCLECHTEDSWSPTSFDHDEIFQLNGGHALISNDCLACHSGGYDNTPNTCIACHQSDYDDATNPDHNEAMLSTDCLDCHTEDSWSPSSFNHDNIFELNGAHALISNDCLSCHSAGFENTPNTCIACHQSDYDDATNPDHNEAMLSTDCLECHTEDSWSPSSFDHDDIFQLNGAHALISNNCLSCHSGGYDNTPNTCIACHQSNYDNTTNPNHEDVMFPTDCLICHSETAWLPSSWDHDAIFPIFSGTHENKWDECIECHIGGNYNSFSCIDCHEHDDPADVLDDHQGVNGYIYESNACLECHPIGEP